MIGLVQFDLIHSLCDCTICHKFLSELFQPGYLCKCVYFSDDKMYVMAKDKSSDLALNRAIWCSVETLCCEFWQKKLFNFKQVTRSIYFTINSHLMLFQL